MASREIDGVWYVEVFRAPDGYLDLQKECVAECLEIDCVTECLGWYEVQELVTGHWCLSRISEGAAYAVDGYTGLKLRCRVIRRANGRLALATYYGDVVAQLSPVKLEVRHIRYDMAVM